MMNRAEAVAYGKRTGCRYFVYNSYGGLLGGFRTRAAAEENRREWQRRYDKDRLNRGTKVYIREEAQE